MNASVYCMGLVKFWQDFVTLVRKRCAYIVSSFVILVKRNDLEFYKKISRIIMNVNLLSQV